MFIFTESVPSDFVFNRSFYTSAVFSLKFTLCFKMQSAMVSYKNCVCVCVVHVLTL